MVNGYAICLKEWILDREIRNELPLLLLISNLCAKIGCCYASNKYFADAFNEHEKAISRKIQKLLSKGYIKAEYKKRGCEVIERKLRVTKLLPDGQQNCYPTSNKNVTYNNISINNKEIYKENFEQWWKEYPRKIDKKKALEKFTTILADKKATLEEIIAGAKKYALHCQEEKTEIRYIKHPTTWLNGECWQNEYTTATPEDYRKKYELF